MVSLFHCQYCPASQNHWVTVNKPRQHVFSTQQAFVSHLKEYHLIVKATQDGKVYICCYGPLGSCGSLETSNKQLLTASSSFLNQRDYEQHLVSAHLLHNMSQDSSFVNAQQSAPIEMIEPKLSLPARWGVLQSVVNLPAVLNDPYYRQVDIFSRTWGDQFERAEVTPLSRLPAIHEKDFADYLTKLSSRVNRKHVPSSPRANVLLQAVRSSAPFRSHPTYSTSATIHSDPTDHLRSSSLDVIPPMFFDLDFNLQQCKTFCQVIPFHSRPLPGDSVTQDLTTFAFPLDDHVPPADNTRRRHQQQQHDFSVQHERLVHYLDIVEVHLADHVSKKSSIFFEAVCCHDVVRDQLSDALDQIKLVRNKMRRVDTSVTYAALRLHRLLKVIASLQAAQPTIQMLLRSNDFCAALDLVASTQDLLVLSSSTSGEHLQVTSDSTSSQFRQLTCLRHLNAQLTEISRFVRHMIEAEFEAALCQFMEPRASCSQYVEPDSV
ncbi:hypothetical protein P879_07717 [Paragonimus westermani]|uniref:Vacuolar protein sorting-associated protein 54 N-terminal domain-containing protein n=1 Tax=Paragonimus westermani TaxID=34504 RepID=A0A8T0DI70_9TREM|nr:hypothetical protein P879_07717 [Paragonimus westermani]